MAKENEHYEHPWQNQTHSTQPPHAQEIAPAPGPLEAVSQDSWSDLRRYTQARIALGRTGSSLPTDELLRFGSAHALARDAVHQPLQIASLCEQLKALGFAALSVNSRASDRHTYLLRPDLGRRLDSASVERLHQHERAKTIDLQIVIGDGLSAVAIERHALPLLLELQQLLPSDWHLGPIVVAEQARVALADEIGEILGARLVAILIGERPGLSSPDSMGIYLTFQPQRGRTDAERNCISNIRPQGLSYPLAAQKLLWLAQEALRQQLTGVELKDESDLRTLSQV